jgi:hypothetical protein
MSQVGFEPTIAVFEQAKRVYASDRAATVIGQNYVSSAKRGMELNIFLEIRRRRVTNLSKRDRKFNSFFLACNVIACTSYWERLHIFLISLASCKKFFETENIACVRV